MNSDPLKTSDSDLVTQNLDDSSEDLLDLPEEFEDGSTSSVLPLEKEIIDLEAKKQALEAEIVALEASKERQIAEVRSALAQMVQMGLQELEEKRNSLATAIEQLERRRERIREEMRTSFAGVSQDIAIRIQSFKDYLVGSLQELSNTAENLELPKLQVQEKTPPPKSEAVEKSASPVTFGDRAFNDRSKQIKQLLEQYRTRPDYYGPPWQLRRTFEPIHAERVKEWYFTQGGRGAIKSMGSRLQNILIASATISIARQIYGDRARSLILADTPERLGEWRRGLQDCLGISRSDFGPDRGAVLFESPEALIQKASRLVEEKQMPLVIIDETEDNISLSLLQFPLWLAFAPEPQQMSSYMF
jgi:hypothetical protein